MEQEGEIMIDTAEVLKLFAEKYAEKYDNRRMESGEKAVAIFNNCIMIIEKADDGLKIEFLVTQHIIINESYDMYVE